MFRAPKILLPDTRLQAFYTLFLHMGRLAGRPCFMAFSTQYNSILPKRKITVDSSQQVCWLLSTSNYSTRKICFLHVQTLTLHRE